MDTNFETIQDVVREIRKVRNEMKVKPNKIIKIQIQADDDKLPILMTQKHIIENMAKCELQFII
jgi:valyl-tRNA synthetase